MFAELEVSVTAAFTPETYPTNLSSGRQTLNKEKRRGQTRRRFHVNKLEAVS